MSDLAQQDRSGDPSARTEDLSRFENLKRKHLYSVDHSSAWRKEAKIEFDYYAGHQWSPEDRSVLEAQMRPVVTFNRSAPIVDNIVGTEINNRQETHFYPRQIGNAGVNEVLTSAAQYVRQGCDAEDEETDSFTDLIICGMGWTETRLVEGAENDLDISIDRIDPLEMYWDPAAKKRNISDAGWISRVKTMSLEKAQSLFPDADPAILNASWASDDIDSRAQPHINRPIKYLFNDDPKKTWEPEQQVTIVEIQWQEPVTYWQVMIPQTQQSQTLQDDEYQTFTQRAGQLGIQFLSVRRTKTVWRRAFLGSEIIAETPLPEDDKRTYECMTGKRDRNKNIWFGVMRAMKDPQMWANKWLSQTLHIINSQAKGGIMAEKSAFEDFRKAETNWARPDSIIWMERGGADRVTPKPVAALPPQTQALLQYAIEAIPQTTGVNVELLGLADRDQAGTLEYQRRQAGITILAAFFNSLRQYRKRQGRLMLELIRDYISDGRLVRIVGNDGSAQYIPLIRDPNTIEYDVVVDEAPSSPNQKEQVWGMLTQMMPFLQEAPLPGQVWADLIRYSPLPDSLTAKIAQAINVPPDQAQEAMANAMKQLTVAKAQADVQNIQTHALRNRAGAIADVAGASKDMADAKHSDVLSAVDAVNSRLDRIHSVLDAHSKIIDNVQKLANPPLPQLGQMNG